VLYLVTVGFQEEEVMLIRSAEEEYGISIPGLDLLVRLFS
jgi:hypothetical protein